MLAAPTTLDYYRELQRFMALLRDGHSRVQLPDSILQRRPYSGPWIELQAVHGRALVANVSSVLADSLPVGSEIVQVAETAVDAFLDEHVLPYVFASAPHSRRSSAIEGSYTRGYGLLIGPADDAVSVAIRTPDERVVRLLLARDRFTAAREWLRPASPARETLSLRWPEPGIAWLALDSFADPELLPRLDSVLPELRRARGIVLDLRRNGGGSDVIAAATLARFTDRALPGTASRIRIHDAYYRALGSFGRPALERALPAGSEELIEQALRHFAGDAWRYEPPDTASAPFDGDRITAPVAVLIGRATGSAAENFLVRAAALPGFTTIGSPTAASTGQPLQFPLPGGGSAQVVTRAVLLPDGTPVVAHGIRPRHPAENSIDDVRLGRDRVLEEALRLLLQQAAGGH